MGYVSLHTHSSHSLLDGFSSVEAHVERAAALGHSAVAITDHQEVSGHLKLQKAAQKHGIAPIYGMEGYFHPRTKYAIEDNLRKADFSHITVLASSNEGLSNLWKWSTKAYHQQRDGRAIVDWEDMQELSEGIWASDGCLLGHLAKAVIADNDQEQHELMGRYLETFGERFFMELHTWQFLDPKTDEERQLNSDMTKVNQAKVDLATQYGVPLVVVNDCHYAKPEEWGKKEIVWRMNTKENPDQTAPGQKADWLMAEDEIVHFMGLHGISEKMTREAIGTTQMIADACSNVEIVRKERIPRLYETDKEELDVLLRELEEGIQRKVIDKGKSEEDYRKQLEFELQTLTPRGFVPYFNVVSKIVNWAKRDAKPPMFVGPGRGSVGGSLVAYLQNITELDPLDYGLLFERFMNPDRPDWPDIDTDFPQTRLHEVKEYAAHVFGADHVCGVGTVTTSKPRALIKDLGKALDVPIKDRNAMTAVMKRIKPDATWKQAMEAFEKPLAPWREKYPELFEEADEFSGMVRQYGTHASAFLISSDPLDGILPMRVKKEKDGTVKVMSQFDGDEVAELGFMKIDFLGIRHDDTIATALELIRERHGKTYALYDFDRQQYADPSIWTGIAEGDNMGIFQIDAESMGETAAKLKPQSEREVAELLAINRPGVINAGLVEPYIRRKHGREEVSYDHPMMEAIAGETYGILIYQEQLMNTSKIIAGFTGGQAEHLRKVVGKKKLDLLPALREQFYEGARANEDFISQCKGNPEKTIDKIWASIEASGEYLFNKSHSVGYALTSAWETWLRHYYYPEYIAALMMTDEEGVAAYVRHARKNGLEILPPDVNTSNRHFTLTDDGIRYGLTDIKGLGDNAYEEIARHRPFTSLEDLMSRTSKQAVNKTVMLAMIRIGALDTLEPDRTKLEGQYYNAAKTPEKDRWVNMPDYSDVLSMFLFEKEILGNFLVNDPIRQYEPLIDKACVQHPEELEELEPGDLARVGGLVTRVKTHTTKKGDPMAFLQVTYHDEDFDVVVFPEAWKANKLFLKEDVPIICRVIRTTKGVHMSSVVRLDMTDLGG